MTLRRRSLALLVALSALAASCGGDDDDSAGADTDPAPATDAAPDSAPDGTAATPGTDAPGTTAAETPRGGDLKIAITGIRDSFDPSSNGAAIKPFISPLFDPLVGIDRDAQPNKETGIASDWEYNADSTSLTVTIRDGVTFHDGSPLTADDVKFSLDRAVSQDSVTSWAGTMRNELDSITVVDPSTVRFDFKMPRPNFHMRLTRLDGQEGYIVSKAYIEGGGDMATAPIGSGPFRFVSAEPNNTTFVLEANPDYWRGLPAFDQLTFMNVDDASTRLNMLKTGEADFIDIPRDLVTDAEDSGFNIIESPVQSHVEVWLLNQWDGLFANPQIREAMNLAIDRETIIATIFDGKADTANFFPNWPTSIGYREGLGPEYDPDRAAQLIQEAGAEGEEITLFTYSLPGLSEGPQLMQALAGYWEAIGLSPQLVQTEYTTVRSQMVEQDPALANSVAWIRDANLRYPDPTMRVLSHSTGALSITHDPELDALIEAVEGADGDDDYIAKLQEAEDYYAENFLRTPIAEVKQLWAGNPDKVPADLNLGQQTSDMDIDPLFFP